MKHGAHGSVMSYVVGFLLSVGLTLAAYVAVANKTITGKGLSLFVAGLAAAQLLVQLLFFLHLGRETKPRWKLITFMFTVMVLIILVVGSLWIMYNLDYTMGGHDAKSLDEEIMEGERIYR